MSETEKHYYTTTCVYRWGDMKVGDVFFAEGKRTTSISSQACVAARKTGHKYKCWTVYGEDRQKLGARVERVA